MNNKLIIIIILRIIIIIIIIIKVIIIIMKITQLTSRLPGQRVVVGASSSVVVRGNACRDQ